jgi:hypothetical protein
MANEVFRRPVVTLPEKFVYPHHMMSGPLIVAIGDHLHPHPDFTQVYSSSACQGEAVLVLKAMKTAMQPAIFETVLAWFWPIGDAVEFTPTEDEFMRRTNALWMAAHEIPNVAWTLEKQREGMRMWRRLPSVAAVIELITPQIRPLIRTVNALGHIAGIENPRSPDHK